VIARRCPSPDEIREALAAAADRTFSYAEVGATADAAAMKALAGRYVVDHHLFPLGEGRELFEATRTALLGWRHFEFAWLELVGGDADAHEGQIVATLTRSLGLWFLNPCRVVYVEASPDAVAFAYGTLPGHVERGEERFSVRFDADTERVTYEIIAFSRPAVLLTMIGFPWVRRIQGRFAAFSAQALARAAYTTTEGEGVG